MAFIRSGSGGLVYLRSSLIPFKHAFTSRAGGVSGGGFASLNLSFGRGDPDENVLENYRILGRALGIDPMKAAYTKQTHGTTVRTVRAGEGLSPTDPAPGEADGLATAEKNMPLFCFTADCVPVLLCDPEAGTAAAVHCGWRSSVGDILRAAVSAMEELGASAENMRAAMGPAIGPCCFETDSDVPEAVERYIGAEAAAPFIRPGAKPGKYTVDLRAADRARLIQLGLRPENIDVSDICTKCRSGEYWSHRASAGGDRGSQCAVITL